MSFIDKLANAVPIGLRKQFDTLAWRVTKHVSTDFTGGTTDAHGDENGTGDPYTLFNVDGDVVVKAVVGIVNTNLVGAATLEVGVAANTAKLLAQVADATTLDDGDVWTDSDTEANIDVQADSGALYFINDGADIIETTGSANITAGQIDYYVIWAPLEKSARIVAADPVT